jgi:hypothetical protein
VYQGRVGSLIADTYAVCLHCSAEHSPSSGGECVGKGFWGKTTVGVTDSRCEFFQSVSVSALGRNYQPSRW